MNSMRWKLILTCSLVAVVPLYVLNRYAINAFDRFTRKALEQEMTSHAMLLGEQYKTMVLGIATEPVPTLTDDYAGMLRRCQTNLESRFRVLTAEGRVRFDSADEDPPGTDLSTLPEIVKAMSGHYGARYALTPDRQYMFYYVALPIRHGDAEVGIVYVSRHTGPIIKAIRVMILNQRLAMIVALAAAIATSAVLSQTMTRRLRRLTKAAMAYARGAAAFDVTIGGRDEIAELGSAIGHMTRELDARNRYNREFISTIMHELRTPLTSIRGAAEVLEHGAADKPEARKKFLANIVYEVERTTRMVEELLELTSLDTENTRGQRESVDYPATVREIMERLHPMLRAGADGAKGPEVALHLPDTDSPIVVNVIPHRIEQVLANLLENAIRYTPRDGRIEVSVKHGPPSMVTTRVRDTGCGISPQNIERIFDRFFTTVPKGTHESFGSGLGLAIVKSIVENHQGTIRVESAPGQGTTFEFTLPAVGSRI